MNPYQTWQLIGIFFAIAILLNTWWARDDIDTWIKERL